MNVIVLRLRRLNLINATRAEVVEEEQREQDGR